MNVLSLQEQLIDRPDDIIKVLLAVGIDETTIREVPSQHLIKCPRPEGDNPAGILVYTDSLRVVGTTRSELSGNLFTLVMKLKNCKFPEALRVTANAIGYKGTEEHNTKLPFGGFYKKIIQSDIDPEYDLVAHSELELPPQTGVSLRFLKDNIPLVTQEEWGVRYSDDDDAILIPVYSMGGKLVGCKARSNRDDIDDSKRWWAYIGYPKTQVVYGLYQNYATIVDKGTMLVFEAEKSVLQCAGYNCNNAVAVAGHSISKTQNRLIQGLLCKRIIVAFDEGLDEEEIRFEAKKLQVKNHLIHNKVGYIYDKEHDILRLGSKDSPSDNGKEVLQRLLKEKVRWLP